MTAERDLTWDDVLDLVTRLDESGLEAASVRVGDVSVEISRSGPLRGGAVRQQAMATDGASVDSERAAVASPAAATQPPAVTSPQPPKPETDDSKGEAAGGDGSPSGTPIPSPMIGVFYRSPSPGADPFVEAGDEVDADTTIGIIEVMKMMNPVTAGRAGRIVEFAVGNAEAVEFGQTIATLDVSA